MHIRTCFTYVWYICGKCLIFLSNVHTMNIMHMHITHTLQNVLPCTCISCIGKIYWLEKIIGHVINCKCIAHIGLILYKYVGEVWLNWRKLLQILHALHYIKSNVCKVCFIYNIVYFSYIQYCIWVKMSRYEPNLHKGEKLNQTNVTVHSSPLEVEPDYGLTAHWQIDWLSLSQTQSCPITFLTLTLWPLEQLRVLAFRTSSVRLQKMIPCPGHFWHILASIARQDVPEFRTIL